MMNETMIFASKWMMKKLMINQLVKLLIEKYFKDYYLKHFSLKMLMAL